MRVVFLQYGGDYREAVQRIKSTGQTTYYAQKHSIDVVAALVGRCELVAVICVLTSEPYDEILESGVRAIGAGMSSSVDQNKLVRLIAELNPDHLILRTPLRGPVKWAVSRGIRTVASLADSFSEGNLRNQFRNYTLARLLNRKEINWVFNHGLNSCVSLKRIGVSPEKIIPWDWPAEVEPDEQPRMLREPGPRTLLYVGYISEAKGVGDILHAMAALSPKFGEVTLQVAGGGDISQFTGMAERLRISHRVGFLGLISHDAILKAMREADAVIVPSRHECPEGFPMTIYETLCSRTPLIASDHPMFRGNLTDGEDSLIFSAGNSEVLARRIEQAFSDPELYHRLSAGSAAAWKRLQLPVKWEDTVVRWLFDSPENRKWFAQHRLSSGIYPLERYR